MRYLFLLLFSLPVFSQSIPDTEVFLFDITTKNNKLTFENGANISQNPGYDNQPCFYENNLLIYSRNRGGETDIAGFDLSDSKQFWVCNTSGGSEFSPQRIPDTKDIAAVRLDTTGLQLLYRYDYGTGESNILIPETKVGYFAFFDQHTILTVVLNKSALDLAKNDLEKNTSKTLVSNVGRSVQKVTGTASMSYTILNEMKKYDLYLLDAQKEEEKSYYICTLPEGTEDYVWLDENRILTGKGPKLYLFDTFGGNEWTEVADLSEYSITDISRLAINEKGNKLALVVTKTE